MYAESTRPSAKSRKNEARSATIELRALGALKLASEALYKNVPAKRADFLPCKYLLEICNSVYREIVIH